MAKKINKFDAPSEGVKAGAPGDEKPTPAVKIKKNGEPFKVRGPSGPRTVNPKIVDFRAAQKVTRATFDAQEKAAWKLFIENLTLEAKTAKTVARAWKKLQDMNPEELAWFQKAVAEKLAASGAPELEQQP